MFVYLSVCDREELKGLGGSNNGIKNRSENITNWNNGSRRVSVQVDDVSKLHFSIILFSSAVLFDV